MTVAETIDRWWSLNACGGKNGGGTPGHQQQHQALHNQQLQKLRNRCHFRRASFNLFISNAFMYFFSPPPFFSYLGQLFFFLPRLISCVMENMVVVFGIVEEEESGGPYFQSRRLYRNNITKVAAPWTRMGICGLFFSVIFFSVP